MRCTCVILLTLTFVFLSIPAAHAIANDPPRFTRPPTVSKTGDRTTIDFAVDRETDVAVFIENAKGGIVRHLAAGVLGKNAPAPLQANALTQRLDWDGKDDDGKLAEGGPFKVRVGLGLAVNYGGTAFAEKSGPNALSSVLGLANGPDGRVYVIDNRSGYYVYPGYSIHVFRRDGSYEKTIKPFAPNLPLDRLKGTGAFINERGYVNPLVKNGLELSYYPFKDGPAAQMVVLDDKLWHTVMAPATRDTHLAAINLDGGIPQEPFAGPALGKEKDGWRFAQVYLAPSSDKKSLLLSCFGTPGGGSLFVAALPFVAQVDLKERGPAKVVFGDLKRAGDDNTHLKNPRGLATDGQGHLLICDFGNNRVVVVNEKDMSFAGSFPVDAPEWIGCDPKSGAVYVCGKENFIKFDGWKDAKEQYRLSLVYQRQGLNPSWAWEFRRSFALDTTSEKPILWIGQNTGLPGLKNPWPLLRCEDTGDKFTDPVPADYYVPPLTRGLTTDPYHSDVGCQVDGSFVILNEETGKAQTVRGVSGHGGLNRLGADGMIYCNAHALGIRRWDRNGKLKPFAATDIPKGPDMGGLPDKAGSSGTTFWERDFRLDRHNDIYATIRGPQYHGLRHLAVFDQAGKIKRTVLWGITDGFLGPRFDAKGNIYMMDSVKPAGSGVPAEFTKHIADPKLQHWYEYMYGSIVKFAPQGGNLWLQNLNKKDQPGADPVALPDSIAKKPIAGTGRRSAAGHVQGALWIVPGVANGGDVLAGGGGTDHCHCTSTDFDVDDFGRTFAPDILRQRVTVLDTNGNTILHFGAYGNQDYCGPDSYVVDPASKLLRPRKADDPKDLKSPFAEPAIAFNWIVSLTVTDRNAYVADVANRRVLRCKLGYATQETVAVDR